jgi:hypothetical protein
MRLVILTAAALALIACSRSDQPPMQSADTLTTRQRDSVIGASRLPGAQGIGRAQAAQDSAAARNAQLDSIR